MVNAETASGLQDGMATASRRMVIATLYCGTGGGREAEFLGALRDAVSDPKRPELRTTVLLDALRGTRPSPDQVGMPLPIRQRQQWPSIELCWQHVLPRCR